MWVVRQAPGQRRFFGVANSGDALSVTEGYGNGIRSENIEKSFGEKQVLSGVSFQAEGERHLVCLAEMGQGKRRLSVS